MLLPHFVASMKRVSFLGCAILLAAASANAQNDSTGSSSSTAGQTTSEQSSSLAGIGDSEVQLAQFTAPKNAFASMAAASAGGGQYGNSGRYGGGSKEGVRQKLTFEAGGGFNAPESNSITYGGNFTVGAGMNFSRRIAGLIEYQFIDDKLPGALIAETGANGGYAHIWSLTFNPVIDLTPKAANGFYVTGGGGFYRKVTSFTDPQETEFCDYYYGYCGVGTVNAVVGHFSSNQGGFSIGGGFEHRMGGLYGDSKTKLFAEARYLRVFTPGVSGITPNGLNTTTVAADTNLIPVTVGIRF